MSTVNAKTKNNKRYELIKSENGKYSVVSVDYIDGQSGGAMDVEDVLIDEIIKSTNDEEALNAFDRFLLDC